MADVYNMLATYCFLHPKEAHSKSKSLSLKALEFNEYLSEAYSSLAWAKMHLDLDWKGVESDFKRAISLNPNYATTYSWYSVLLVILGRINEAHEMIRKALELDPLSLPINNIAASHYYSGREYNKTIEYCKKTIEIDSNFHAVHYTLGNAYIQKKLFNEAIAEQQKALNLSGGSLEYLIALAYTYGFAGNKEEALKILNDILQSSKYEYVPLSRISLIYISLGEFNTAIKYLEKAFEEQDISWHFLFIKVDPMFDSLREDVRFKSLLKKVGLDN